jgi:hypothetical protein
MVTQLQTGSIRGGDGPSNASWHSPAVGRSARAVDFSSSLSRTPGSILGGPEVTGDVLEASSFGHQVVYSASASLSGPPRGSLAATSPDGLADLMHQSSPLDYRASVDFARINKLPAASSLLGVKSSASFAPSHLTTAGATSAGGGPSAPPKYFWQQEDFAVIDES